MTEGELHHYLRSHYSRENESCEWKAFENLKHHVSGKAGEDIISYVSGISNMEGGHLVIGTEDNSLHIEGIQDKGNYTPENLPNKLRDNCTSLNTEGLLVAEFVTSDTGKIVWVLHIPKHLPRQPVFAHKKAWQRVGESLVSITEERRSAILAEPIYQTEDWSAAICPGATIEDLDPMAIEKARENYINKYPHLRAIFDTWDDATFLNRAKITKKEQITRTAIILLGKPESEHFIGLAEAKIRWILEGENRDKKDHAIFSCPLLLAIDEVFARIRNLKYRYIREPNTLFPDEVDQYDPFTIREALNNCIAHQDYTMSGRINVVETENGLLFSNKGSFIPGSVETVIQSNAPEETYRNPFLAAAMVNLKMVDTAGNGIQELFRIQRKKFFPLPDYDLTGQRVTVTITSKVLDPNYAIVLSRNPELTLTEIMMLDKVQKRKQLTEEEIKHLRNKGLIEGRKPNFHISAKLAATTGQQSDYILAKGVEDEFYKKLVEDYINKFGPTSRKDLESLLLPKLPEVYSDEQKRSKIKNMLQNMKNKGRIASIKGKLWDIGLPLIDSL